MTNVIEIIQRGPQGIPGPVGPVGPQGPSLYMAASTSTDTTAVPFYNGSNEVVVDLGTYSDAYLDIANGVITAVQEVPRFISTLELHTKTAGGGNKITTVTLWAESSADSGSTWALVPNSLRTQNVADESEGFNNYDLSTFGPTLIGNQLRLKCTNLGEASSNLSIDPPDDVATTIGVVSGRSAKISFNF
jgi:hypothetical protein